MYFYCITVLLFNLTSGLYTANYYLVVETGAKRGLVRATSLNVHISPKMMDEIIKEL